MPKSGSITENESVLRALLIIVTLLLTAKVLKRPPSWDGTLATAQHWAILWGWLRLAWIAFFLYEAYRLVQWAVWG